VVKQALYVREGGRKRGKKKVNKAQNNNIKQNKMKVEEEMTITHAKKA
jgi:hypothetical protein